MRRYCSEGPEYHPEFGLLCRSARQRRIAGMTTICLLSIMVIGASRVLTDSHRAEAEETIMASRLMPVELRLQPQESEETGEEPAVPPQDRCKNLSRGDPTAYLPNPECKVKGRHGQHKNEPAAIAVARIELQSAAMPP